MKESHSVIGRSDLRIAVVLLLLAPAVSGRDADPTAGWKTYRNAKYGFELKYPPKWELWEEESPDIPGTDRDLYVFRLVIGPALEGLETYSLDISIFRNPKRLTARLYAEELVREANAGEIGGYLYDRAFDVVVNGRKGYELYNLFAYDERDEIIYLTHGARAYHVMFPVATPNPNLAAPAKNNRISHVIVSTLRIIADE